MRTRKVVHEGSQLGLALNEIEGILKENNIEELRLRSRDFSHE